MLVVIEVCAFDLSTARSLLARLRIRGKRCANAAGFRLHVVLANSVESTTSVVPNSCWTKDVIRRYGWFSEKLTG